jgi:hypothetical protein
MTTDDEAERAARAKKGSPFLSTAQAAFYVGLSRRTLEKMRVVGGGPPYRKMAAMSATTSTTSMPGLWAGPRNRPPMSSERAFLNRALHLALRARHGHPRRAIPAIIAIGIAFVTTPVALEITPRVVWNTSASAPLGLYLVGGKSPRKRDLVLAQLPESVRRLADERGYLPSGAPLIKHAAPFPAITFAPSDARF